MKINLLIIFILIFWLFSCSEENVNNPIKSSTWIINNEINIEQNNDNINVKEILTEAEKEKIDEYNFSQLEIVKSRLDNLPRDSYVLNSYMDFNEKFEDKLNPIKNCYYLRTWNWDNPYLFWFKLESEKYITNYWTWFYSYPSYDLPIDNFCFSKCIDRNYDKFINVVNSTCWNYVSWYIYDDENKNWIKDIWEKWLEGVALLIGIDFTLTDKNWYFSFWDLYWQSYEINIRYLTDYYISIGSIKTYKIEFNEWENVKNLNIWVERSDRMKNIKMILDNDSY